MMQDDPLNDLELALERAKAQIRARVEHPFHIVKNLFPHRKMRYKGLGKNSAQLFGLYTFESGDRAKSVGGDSWEQSVAVRNITLILGSNSLESAALHFGIRKFRTSAADNLAVFSFFLSYGLSNKKSTRLCCCHIPCFRDRHRRLEGWRCQHGRIGARAFARTTTMKPRAFFRLKLPLLVVSVAALHASAHAQIQLPAGCPVQNAAQLIIERPLTSITIAPTPGTTLDIPADTPIDAIVETGPTFAVKEIVLQLPDGKPFEPPRGISAKQLATIAEPFVNHDLGSHRINVLLKRITDVFVAHGLVTTRALLGPQNLATGTLKITIQVGTIEAFTVNDEPIRRLKAGEASAGGGWHTDAGYANAFPTATGEPLRLSNIEQGVAQINRLRRNQATVQIVPGQNPGESIVDICNQSYDRLYYTLGVGNYGSSATGVTRYRADVEADILLGLQESPSVNFLDSLDSNAIVGSFAVPFGRHTFSYTISDSEYQQVIGTTALEYGRTLSHIFGWNYLVSRSVSDITSVDATVSWRRTDREINGIDLDPQRVAVLRLVGNWLHNL